jgi:hypothetical protein
MKKINIFAAIAIAMLIVGNILCYAYNDRLLHPITNIVMVALIYINFIKK